MNDQTSDQTSDRTGEPGEAAAAHPTAAQLLQQGLFHHRRGEIALAMERYTEVLRNDPRNAEALYYCAVVACQEDQFDQGIALARRALEYGPPQARMHNLIGKALDRQGGHTEAVKSFDAAIALDPNFAEAHGNRANILALAGLTDQAIAGFERALALDPMSVADWINFGALLQELGRHEEALAIYDKALTLVPDNATVSINRANALVKLGRYTEAEAGFDEVIKRDPNHLLAYSRKGTAQHQLRRFEEALDSYDKALAIAPDFAPALSGKRRTLYILGRLDEARALIEKAIEQDPDNIDFYCDLTEMKRFEPGDPLLPAMEKLLSDPASRSDRDRIYLHFALAKAYRDIGQTEREFDHLVQGNALKRRQINYDEQASMKRVERICQLFTPELMRSKSGRGDLSRRPIFIIGMPRSGTTLVEQILASHPRVHGAGELNDFRDALISVTGRRDYPDLVTGMTDLQMRELGPLYLSKVAAVIPEAGRFTDKMPVNFLFAGLIHLALPHARIIHVRRNPIDTCLSCYATLFADAQEFAYELGELGRYYRDYEKLMAHWRQVLPEGAMLDVQYEDVVKDIETQTRRMLAYCDLEWDDACLAFHQTQRPVHTASAAQVRQPLYSSSVGRWQPYESRLQPLLQALEPSA